MGRIPAYALYLVDADGTLLDFDAAEAVALTLTFRHFGLPEGAMESYRRINSALWQRLAEGAITREALFSQRFGLLAQEQGLSLDSAGVNRFFLEQLSHQAQLIPGALETLQWLSKNARVAIVTNGVSFVQRERFRRCGLLPYIQQLIISEEVGAEKPSPLIFKCALEACGHSDKAGVLMVGDEPLTDIAGARAFGIASCLVDFHGKNPAHQADYCITSLYELSGSPD